MVGSTHAQDFYRNNPWIFGYNASIVIEDAQQFKGYFNRTPVKWNFSPFNFTAEKRLTHGGGLGFSIGSNVYPNKQRMDGLTLTKPVDIFNIESSYRYNFNYVVKEDNNFDPFIGALAGIWLKSNEAFPTIGVFFGFNQWITNSFGFTSGIQYKALFKSEDEIRSNGLIQINLGIVHIVN